MVVADSSCLERSRFPGKGAISQSLPEGDGDDPLDHLHHRQRGQPEIAMPPATHRGEQACPRQLREMGAGGLGRDSRGQSELARGQGPAVDERQQHRGSRGVSDERRDLGEDRTCDHARYLTPDRPRTHSITDRWPAGRRFRSLGRGARARRRAADGCAPRRRRAQVTARAVLLAAHRAKPVAVRHPSVSLGGVYQRVGQDEEAQA